MILFNRHQPTGQGLLEATIAIGVVLVGLIGTVTLTTSTVVSSGESESRIVAANLAREGIEAVRIIRDSNWLSGPTTSWDSGINDATDLTALTMLNPTTFAWSLDFTPTDFTDSRTILWRDVTSGLYLHNLSAPASQTPYARLVKLYAICRQSSVETATAASCQAGTGTKVGVRVVAIVQWAEAGRAHQLSLEDWLYNWRFAPPSYVP